MKKKWNVFNLYKINVWPSIYKDKKNSLKDIKSIDDFDFSGILPVNKQFHELSDKLLSSYSNISACFYTASDDGKTLSWGNIFEKITWKKCSLKNTSHSYILFIFYNGKNWKHLFAIAWWNWYQIIKNSIDSTFPFSLINKLLDNTWVFWFVKQNNLVWQETYVERWFVSEYDVLSETNYWILNKEANVKIPKEKLLEIWLDIEKKDKAGIFLSKWFKIIKSIQFEDLIWIIKSVVSKLGDKDLAKLNRISRVESNTTRNQLYLQLFQTLKNNIWSIVFLPDNEKLLFSCDEKLVYIKSVKHNIDDIQTMLGTLKIEDKINFENSFLNVDFLTDIDDIGKAIKYFDNYDIELRQDDNHEKFKFIKSIYTDISYKKWKYIFIHWEFYSLNIDVLNLIDKDFKDLLSDNGTWIILDDILPKKWEKKIQEKKYLSLYDNDKNYFKLDWFTPENVEFCDLLYLSKNKIYLIHAKTGFWNVSRDHALQAQMSCEKIVHNINSTNKTYFKAIYTHCISKFGTEFREHYKTETDFIEWMMNKDGIFVVILTWYISNSWDLCKSDSYIGKVSMLEAIKKITYTFGFKTKNVWLFNWFR